MNDGPFSAARAVDPAATLQELLSLARAYPREVLSNPALPLLALEDPAQARELIRVASYQRAKLDLYRWLARAGAENQRRLAVVCAESLLPWYEEVHPGPAPPWSGAPIDHPRNAIARARSRLQDRTPPGAFPYNDLFADDETIRAQASRTLDVFCWQLPEGVAGIGFSYDYYRYHWSAGLVAAVCYCAASDYPGRIGELVISALYHRAHDDLVTAPDASSEEAPIPCEIGRCERWRGKELEAKIEERALQRLEKLLSLSRDITRESRRQREAQALPQRLLALAQHRPFAVLRHHALQRLSSQSQALILGAAQGTLARRAIQEGIRRADQETRRRFALACVERVLPLYDALSLDGGLLETAHPRAIVAAPRPHRPGSLNRPAGRFSLAFWELPRFDFTFGGKEAGLLALGRWLEEAGAVEVSAQHVAALILAAAYCAAYDRYAGASVCAAAAFGSHTLLQNPGLQAPLEVLALPALKWQASWFSTE